MAEVALHEVTKVFPGGTTAVESLTATIADGEFMVLVGPSGCGKTTVLRMVAGLENPTSGAVAIGGEVVNGVPPRSRDIAMVFQSYALYPQKTVKENLSFGLKMHKVPREQIETRVAEIADLLALTDLLERKPAQLSGGQRQRVAMGRALAREPRAFLLDEPLSNLDAQLRTSLRAELKAIHQRFPTTSLYVTHDQVEAMTLGDRIAVMNAGRLLQLDTPDRIYGYPASLFVASFIGSPPMNLVHARARDGQVTVGGSTFPVAGAHGEDVVLGLRPEALRLEGGADEPSLAVQVHLVEALGHEVIVHATMPGRNWSVAHEEVTGLVPLDTERATFIVRLPSPQAIRVGDSVPLRFAQEDVHLFDTATGEALPV